MQSRELSVVSFKTSDDKDWYVILHVGVMYVGNNEVEPTTEANRHSKYRDIAKAIVTSE